MDIDQYIIWLFLSPMCVLFIPSWVMDMYIFQNMIASDICMGFIDGGLASAQGLFIGVQIPSSFAIHFIMSCSAFKNRLNSYRFQDQTEWCTDWSIRSCIKAKYEKIFQYSLTFIYFLVFHFCWIHCKEHHQYNWPLLVQLYWCC